MVYSTEALPVTEIERMATITQLDDVVGIHAVRGMCLGAPVPIVLSLAPVSCPGHDLGTPGPEGWGIVDCIFPFLLRPDCPAVHGPDHRGEGTQSSHRMACHAQPPGGGYSRLDEDG